MSREFCALCKVNYQVKLNHSSECPYCRIAELEAQNFIYEKKKPWSMEDLAALLKEGDYYSPLPDWSCQC
jgi:hypothetical protein